MTYFPSAKLYPKVVIHHSVANMAGYCWCRDSVGKVIYQRVWYYELLIFHEWD